MTILTLTYLLVCFNAKPFSGSWFVLNLLFWNRVFISLWWS